jgi:hypothetical protein
MPPAQVIQLRQVLLEKFPGLRLRLEERPAGGRAGGSPQLEELLHNADARGALTEIVAAEKSAGSATLLRAVIHWAASRHQIAGLIDGSDCFDVTRVAESDLAQVLWVRCPDADKALRAADLLLRDGNLPLVILDLKFNPEAQLRKISATTWYRFQRLVETTSALCLVFTPRAMVAPARTRFILHSHFTLADLERDADELLRELKMDAARSHQLHAAAEQKIA